MMKFRRSNRVLNALIAALVVVMIGAFAGNTFLTPIVTRGTTAILSPLLGSSRKINALFGSAASMLRSKWGLLSENTDLKRENESLRISLTEQKVVVEENKELRALVGRKNNDGASVAGFIIGMPPQSPYDTIMLDVGEADGVGRGMRVMSPTGVFLGSIEETLPRTSVARLISSPGVVTQVRIAERNVMADATGRGGGNFEITLPSSVDVRVGDTVVTPGLDFALVGVVEAVSVDLTNPVEKLFLRMPVSVRSAHGVLVMLY